MKIRSVLLFFALIALFVARFPQSANAQEVDYSYFYDNLSPYGEWVDVERYGYCFRPVGTPPGWRPYTDGNWAYTDAGWTWVSDEPFGPITYHYGRWFHLHGVGWLWRPGSTWGPAWVSWRQSDEYVGWAPLPPEAAFRAEAGIGVGVDVEFDIGPSFFSFCAFRQFGAPVMREVILPPERNVAIIQNSTNITNITTINNNNTTVVYNGGPSYQKVAAQSQQPIRTLRLQREPVGAGGKIAPTHQVGNMLVMSAPVVKKSPGAVAPRTVARTLTAPQIDKGWGAVQDPAVRQKIQQHYAQQTMGRTPKQLAAKPVNMHVAHAVLPPASPVKPGQPSAPVTPGTSGPKPSGMTPERAHAAPEGAPVPHRSPKPQGAVPEKAHAAPEGAPVPHRSPKPQGAAPEKAHAAPEGAPVPHRSPKPQGAAPEKAHAAPEGAPVPHRSPKPQGAAPEKAHAAPEGAPVPHRSPKPQGAAPERAHAAPEGASVPHRSPKPQGAAPERARVASPQAAAPHSAQRPPGPGAGAPASSSHGSSSSQGQDDRKKKKESNP